MNKPGFQLFAIYYLITQTAVRGFNCTADIIPEFDEIQKCCDSPTIIQTEIINECVNEGPLVLKWAECYFKKIDAIANGKPSTDELKARAKIVLSEYPEWGYKFDAVIDKCNDEVIAKNAETQKRLSGPPFNMKKVNSIYAHLITCIDAGLWLECPDVKRDNSSKCIEIHDYMQECLKDFPPPYFTFDI